MKRLFTLLLITLAAAPATACPWHALAGQPLDQLANVKRVLMIDQIDRMTGKETLVKGGAARVDLPAHYGFSCDVAPGKSAGEFVLSCERQGTRTALEHSCQGPDAAIVKQWDGFDRMGLNILSVVLACVPEPSTATH